MFKLFVTLLRGQNADAAETIADQMALPLLRQQMRDCAAGVETARRSVAMVMAYGERERKSAARIAIQLADLEARAMDALAKGRDDLATEAAGAIAQLEAEAATTARAIATYDAEIAHLRNSLAEAEARLRDLQRGQRMAIATDHTQRLRGTAATTASLAEAETTLARLQDRQANTEATRAGLLELSASSNAEVMQNRLAAAGCGAPLRPDAAQVLNRLKSKAA
jgi:phage shock protein A